MSSARPTLAAAHRSVTGKKVAYLRRDGRLPAVVYGRGLESASVSVNTHEIETLRRHAAPNTLVDLSLEGEKPPPGLIHGLQLHRITRKPLHVDLYVVRLTEELTLDDPHNAEGK